MNRLGAGQFGVRNLVVTFFLLFQNVQFVSGCPSIDTGLFAGLRISRVISDKM